MGMDLEPSTLDRTVLDFWLALRPDRINWMKGHHTDDAELIESVLDVVRLMARAAVPCRVYFLWDIRWVELLVLARPLLFRKRVVELLS